MKHIRTYPQNEMRIEKIWAYPRFQAIFDQKIHTKHDDAPQ